MTFYERYEACCFKKRIKPCSNEAAEKMGCTRANISAFAKNGTTPKGDIVASAAVMLDVSADYLLGISDNPRKLNSLNSLTPTEQEAVELIRELNGEGQEAVLAMIKGVASQASYKKCPAAEVDNKKQA